MLSLIFKAGPLDAYATAAYIGPPVFEILIFVLAIWLNPRARKRKATQEPIGSGQSMTSSNMAITATESNVGALVKRAGRPTHLFNTRSSKFLPDALHSPNQFHDGNPERSLQIEYLRKFDYRDSDTRDR